jgi:hypothetical protein
MISTDFKSILILIFLICHSEQSEESELLFFDVKTPDSSLCSE